MFEFLTRVYALGSVPLQLTNPLCGADIDLDTLSVAPSGWQGTGKASLIEAISGITLPRASGTCTVTWSVLQDRRERTALL